MQFLYNNFQVHINSHCIRVLQAGLANIPTMRTMHTQDGRTALHLAAERGYVGIAQLLLSKGACIDARDQVGRRVQAARVKHTSSTMAQSQPCWYLSFCNLKGRCTDQGCMFFMLHQSVISKQWCNCTTTSICHTNLLSNLPTSRRKLNVGQSNKISSAYHYHSIAIEKHWFCFVPSNDYSCDQGPSCILRTRSNRKERLMLLPCEVYSQFSCWGCIPLHIEIAQEVKTNRIGIR
jgi:hypothetical protein